MLWARLPYFFAQHTYAAARITRPSSCYFFYPNRQSRGDRALHGATWQGSKEQLQGACPVPSEIFFTGKTRRGIQKKHAAPIRPWPQGRCAEAPGIQKSSGQERQAPPKEAAPKTRIKAAESAARRLKDAAADVSTHGRGWPENGHKKSSHI